MKAGTQAVIEELGKLEPLLAEAAAEEAAEAVAVAKEKERVRTERREAIGAAQVCTRKTPYSFPSSPPQHTHNQHTLSHHHHAPFLYLHKLLDESSLSAFSADYQ